MSSSVLSSPFAGSAERAAVLADVLLGARGLAASTLLRDALLVLSGAGLVGLLAQVSVPMSPVAITGQTLGVMLVGAALGSRRAAMAMTTYLALGLAGLPWFANLGGGAAYVLAPSFGFIVGFIPAAWVAGWLAERRWDRRPLASLAAFGLATLVPFFVGVPWMWANLHLISGQTLGFAEVLQLGVVPFIPGGILKALLASLAMRGLWKLAR